MPSNEQSPETKEAITDMGVRGVAVLVGMAKGQECDRLFALLAHGNGHPGSQRGVVLASNWTELESRAACLNPCAIVLSEGVLPSDVSIEEAARKLARFAPVAVIASLETQSELVRLLITGEVDFMARSGEFISVAAALVERRLRSPQPAEIEFHSAWAADLPSDFAEILRHEINNPLTGILGNAELLLSQLRGNLAPVYVQRLETIVDLAVRLRETIRCLSSEWERQHSASIYSA